MLWNYHCEFGSRLLFEQFNIQKMQQIWTLTFLKVVWQHILGVVDNVIHCSVGNLTGFPAVKEFRKSVKIWRNHRHERVAHFLRHSVHPLLEIHSFKSSPSSLSSSSPSSNECLAVTATWYYSLVVFTCCRVELKPRLCGRRLNSIVQTHFVRPPSTLGNSSQLFRHRS